MQQSIRPALRVFGPLAVAYSAIKLEAQLTALVQSRPGVLPVAMVAMLAGLLVPQVRRALIITLCFTISLLALQDAVTRVHLPAEFDYVGVERLVPYGWAALSILAATAGLAEALHSESVWARRCYFGAASLYFTGHGLLGYAHQPNWGSLVLLGTGIIAAFGVVFAHRIVAAEQETGLDDEDLKAQAERDARRAEALAAREWRDSEELSTSR